MAEAMSTQTAGNPLTYEEEREKPMPGLNHSWVQANLIIEFAKQRAYRIHSELNLDIDGRHLTPDISLYPRPMAFNLSRDLIRSPVPPATVVEISPQQGSYEMLKKVNSCFELGVACVWLVAPLMHRIDIHIPDDSVKHYTTGSATDPATGIPVDADAVFTP